MLDDLAKMIAQGLINNSLDTCSRWAEHKVWMPKPYDGPVNWRKFPWTPTILNANDPMVTVMKAAQMGFSVAGLIKALFKVCQEREDVLYVLPTRDLAGDFAKARLDALVALSPELANVFTKSNNVGLKTTKDHAHIFIRGSVAESGLVSVPVGTAIVDEFDRCNPDAMPLVLKRLAAHQRKHFFGLSTPTVPEYGINEQYLLGTQEHFFFKCPHCSRKTELIWPDCIEIFGDCATSEDVHRSYYKCKECQHRLEHLPEAKEEWLSTGFWEPTHKAYGHRSFWINQMYGPGLTPGELVIDYFLGQNSEKANVQFHNQILGIPYLMRGGKVTEELINAALAEHSKFDTRPPDARGMRTMGVDVGSFLDIVISEFIYDSEPGNEPHLHSINKVLWEGRLAGDDWEGLSQKMEEWQIHHCCIDFQPETVLAKAFARKHGKCVSLVQYRKGTSGDEIKAAEDGDGVVTLTVDRTSFFDMSLGRFHSGRLWLPKDLSGVFREHVQVPNRTYVVDEFGQPKAKYLSNPNKADHLAHALLYTEVAHFQAYNRTTGRAIKAGEAYFNF